VGLNSTQRTPTITEWSSDAQNRKGPASAPEAPSRRDRPHSSGRKRHCGKFAPRDRRTASVPGAAPSASTEGAGDGLRRTARQAPLCLCFVDPVASAGSPHAWAGLRLCQDGTGPWSARRRPAHTPAAFPGVKRAHRLLVFRRSAPGAASSLPSIPLSEKLSIQNSATHWAGASTDCGRGGWGRSRWATTPA
jgi:hypothetical protein